MDTHELPPSRVLVVLEGAEPSNDTLAQLSRVLGTNALELVGLFVEDEDLYRAVSLPVFREVSLTGEVLESDHDRLQRDIDGELRRLSVNFETAVRAFRYQCHVEVVRGHWLDTLSEVAKEFALVLVSRTERVSGLQRRGVPDFRLLLKPGRNILIVNEPWSSGHSVVVVGADPQALHAGHRIAQPERLDLVVVLSADTPVPKDLPEGAVVVRIKEWTEAAVTNICRRWDARLLVAREEPRNHSILVGLLDRLPCSLLRLA